MVLALVEYDQAMFGTMADTTSTASVICTSFPPFLDQRRLDSRNMCRGFQLYIPGRKFE